MGFFLEIFNFFYIYAIYLSLLVNFIAVILLIFVSIYIIDRMWTGQFMASKTQFRFFHFFMDLLSWWRAPIVIETQGQNAEGRSESGANLHPPKESSSRKLNSMLQSAKTHVSMEVLTQNRLRNRGMNPPIQLATITTEKHLFRKKKKKINFSLPCFSWSYHVHYFPMLNCQSALISDRNSMLA